MENYSGSLTTWAYTSIGVLLLLWVGYDIYTVVLHARGRAGPISELLSRGLWQAAHPVAFRLSRQRRHQLLNAVGPILLPLLIGIFVVQLVVGFALIYYPQMPGGFTFASPPENPLWIESLYVSGTTLVTIGYGDITPRTPAMRLVALAEGASGLALISLMVTYLLTVYGALERKRAVALFFYHQAGEGADVARLVTHYFVGGRFRRLATTLGAASRDLQGLLESHYEHPIIHYFHPIEVYKSLPRMLFLALETCTVIHSCLDRTKHNQIRKDPEVRLLSATARHVLSKLNEALHPARETKQGSENIPSRQQRWQVRFDDTIKRLNEAGIATAENPEQAWADYCRGRAEWEPELERLAAFLGYDWEEITGDLDLRYAADEKQKEPQIEVGV